MDISRALGGFVNFIKAHAPWLSSEDHSSNMTGINYYRGIDAQMAQLKEGRAWRCLLSLDGGGFRGFSQLFILEELANRIMHDLKLQQSPPLCNYFDMIGGVGTGGYLAILAGRLGLTVPQLKEEFWSLAVLIMAGSVSSDEMNNFLKAVVKRYTGNSETKMYDPDSPTSHCKTFVGAITTGNASYLTIFRSYESRDSLLNITIWQAARATLAHPDLFPPTRIGSPEFEQVYVSGEIGWKNPSNEVIREFEALWPSHNIACLASIGSGHEGVIQIDGQSVSQAVADVMGRIATDSGRVEQGVAYRFQGRNTYFRLNVEQGLQQNVHRQPFTLPEIETHTRSYLRSSDARNTLDQLVASLLHTIEVSTWTTTRDHFKTTINGYIFEYRQVVDDISVAAVQLSVQEGLLLLETIRGIKHSEDNWLVFAKIIASQFKSLNHRVIMEFREPLSLNPLWASIKNYYAEMKLVRNNLAELVEMNPHRVWGPPTHETFLANAISNLDESFKRISMDVLNDTHDHIVSIKRDAYFDAFIAWVSALDMDKRHHDVQSRRSQGTGSWLVETPEFKNWFENRALEGCRALLGLGDPGTGKTFACSFLIDYLRSILDQRRAALIYIYCDSCGKYKQDVCSIVGELAKQLLLQSSPIPDEVWGLFEKHTSITTEKAQKIFTLLLSNFESTYICIDALDEFESQSRGSLLRFLATLKGTSLHIFCTGRTSVESEATELLGPFGIKTMEIFAHNEDLRRHIEAQITQDRNQKAMDEQFQEEITKQLVSRSRKLFILPALQLQFILEQPTKRKRREALNSMPTELFNMYRVTLDRIRQQPASQAEMAMSILTWVYLARRKLRVYELQHALAVEPGDAAFDKEGIPSEESLLDCCLGLVVIEPETATIWFTHFTFQEYLDKHWQELFPNGHSIITSICLTTLNFEQLDEEAFTLLHYAVDFMGDHLRILRGANQELDCQALELLNSEAKFQSLGSLPSHWSSLSLSSPLHWIAYFGIISLGRHLLLQINDRPINLCCGSGRTSLSIAAEQGHEAVVQLLLGVEGVAVDSKDWDERTPLSHAAERGHEAVVKLLLDVQGIKVNSKCQCGKTPLSYAVELGHKAVVKVLLGTEGIDVNSKCHLKKTPLSYAAENGHEAVVKLLLRVKDVEVDPRDEDGRTPLSHAAASGSGAVVELLLGVKGIEVNSKSRFGNTPFFYAVKLGHEAVVKILLGMECVKIDLRDKNGQTPLSHAAAYGYEAVVQLLLNVENIKIDPRDLDGRTPLSYAAENGHEAIIKLLLDTIGVEVNSKDKKKRTPLSYAAAHGHEAVVKLLLGVEGIEVGLKDWYGRTPLSYAASGGHKAVIKRLLTRSTNITLKEEERKTPMTDIVELANEIVIKLL